MKKLEKVKKMKVKPPQSEIQKNIPKLKKTIPQTNRHP